MPLVVHLTSRVDFLEEVKAKKHIHVFSRAKTFVKAETNTPFWCIFFFKVFVLSGETRERLGGKGGDRQTETESETERQTGD